MPVSSQHFGGELTDQSSFLSRMTVNSSPHTKSTPSAVRNQHTQWWLSRSISGTLGGGKEAVA